LQGRECTGYFGVPGAQNVDGCTVAQKPIVAEPNEVAQLDGQVQPGCAGNRPALQGSLAKDFRVAEL
jgi:hypothetical protein